jgi:FtsH ternary system domain X6
MQTVTRFEANLLRLLYYFLEREPAELALAGLAERSTPPVCLSRSAVRLVQDALAKGCAHLLAHRGGWRVESQLRGDRAIEGRLWQRTPPAALGLTFSRHALEFLIWITSARPGDKEPHWRPAEEELTPGDLLLLYFAHQGLRDSAASLGAAALRRRPPFVRHGLCWLAYPEDFTAAPEEFAPNFAPWTNGVGAAMLEALQPELATRWIEVEGGKGSIIEWQRMRDLGRSQVRVLTAFLDALEKAGRLDLARFLLRAAKQLVGPNANAAMWVEAMTDAGPRLAERTATYASALAFLHQLPRLQSWDRRARSVGYFDEGYQAAQLWKADWERYDGGAVSERARAIIRQLDPLHQA